MVHDGCIYNGFLNYSDYIRTRQAITPDSTARRVVPGIVKSWLG